MTKTKLSRYFLCTLLILFGNAWCADLHEPPKTTIALFQAEVMKMEIPFRVPISVGATDVAKKDELVEHLRITIPTFVPGKYTYFENRIYEHIKDLSVISLLRYQIYSLWETAKEGVKLSCITSAIPEIADTATLPIDRPSTLDPFEISAVPTIYIYQDDGVSESTANDIKKAFMELGESYVTQTINADHTKEGKWRLNAIAYFIPGGSGRKIHEKLKGDGNTHIREFIERGGVYIGICAGAYYGSQFEEFNTFDTTSTIDQKTNELAFFKGVAVGPALAPFSTTSKSGVRIAHIKHNLSGADQICNVYFNGGCFFKDTYQSPNTKIIGTYNNEGFEGLAALIECKVGLGKAVLSGVHPEVGLDELREFEGLLSERDWLHLEQDIFPDLRDESHKRLFKDIIQHAFKEEIV